MLRSEQLFCSAPSILFMFFLPLIIRIIHAPIKMEPNRNKTMNISISEIVSRWFLLLAPALYVDFCWYGSERATLTLSLPAANCEMFWNSISGSKISAAGSSLSDGTWQISRLRWYCPWSKQIHEVFVWESASPFSIGLISLHCTWLQYFCGCLKQQEHLNKKQNINNQRKWKRCKFRRKWGIKVWRGSILTHPFSCRFLWIASAIDSWYKLCLVVFESESDEAKQRKRNCEHFSASRPISRLNMRQ